MASWAEQELEAGREREALLERRLAAAHERERAAEADAAQLRRELARAGPLGSRPSTPASAAAPPAASGSPGSAADARARLLVTNPLFSASLSEGWAGFAAAAPPACDSSALHASAASPRGLHRAVSVPGRPPLREASWAAPGRQPSGGSAASGYVTPWSTVGPLVETTSGPASVPGQFHRSVSAGPNRRRREWAIPAEGEALRASALAELLSSARRGQGGGDTPAASGSPGDGA
jgi:hypothetical protein